MVSKILDSDYMDMDLGIAYRFLDNKTALTEMHNHNYCEYFIITSGSITHEVNGTSQELKTGDMVFIRPSDCHRYRITDQKSCNIINVSFRMIYFESVLKYLDNPIMTDMYNAPKPPTITLPSTRLSALKKKHFLLNVCSDLTELTALLRALICDVFADFIMEYERQSQNSAEKWLNSVLIQMNTPENIEEGLSALLRLSGFSHGHLCRIMKKEFGITPSKYITDLRLQYAANLLSFTDHDILSISVQLGFSSLSHFITIFKKKYGVSPSKYRSTHSNFHTWK